MNLKNLNKEELLAAIEVATALEHKYKYNKAQMYFPETGKYSRDKYPVQMDLMRAGLKHRLRAFIGGNASGKSLWLALESYFHLSGRYPKWWEGYKYNNPINAWLCGLDAKALRAGLQMILFGGIGDEDFGTGIIAREDMTDDKGILQKWALSGTANCIGQFRVKHYTNGIFDGWSTCEFMTYEQGWGAFQGPTKDWIGFDEEPEDGKIFAECVMRLRGKDGGKPGHFLAAFTPTGGMRDVYLAFVPKGQFPENGLHPEDPSKYTCRVGWSNSPHLDDEFKASALAQLKLTDPNNIEARTEGYAAMGSGRVYPIDESFVVVSKFKIPSYWPRCYGMDPGQANFAVVWIAEDPNTHVKYIYDEYKYGKVNYLMHVEAIKNRGQWIPGSIDPHEAVKPRDTGETVQTYFESQDLQITAAKGDPDALRMRIRAMYETGALKIMDNCTGVIEEIRTYRYDQNDPNKIARGQEDHRMDAKMYAICVFDSIAQSYAELEEENFNNNHDMDYFDNERNNITGY